VFQSMSEIKSRKMNFENKCATVEKPHLPYFAHNAQIISIAVIHMEGRVGQGVRLTSNAIDSPRYGALIMVSRNSYLPKKN